MSFLIGEIFLSLLLAAVVFFAMGLLCGRSLWLRYKFGALRVMEVNTELKQENSELRERLDRIAVGRLGKENTDLRKKLKALSARVEELERAPTDLNGAPVDFGENVEADAIGSDRTGAVANSGKPHEADPARIETTLASHVR